MFPVSISAPASILAALFAVSPARGQTAQDSSGCYRLTYDSMQPGFGRDVMPFTLVLRPGKTRASASTEDTTSIWRFGAGNSNWWRARDSIFVLLGVADREYMMSLGQSGDTLKGWVEYRTDNMIAGRMSPSARLVAIPKHCEHA